MIEINEVMENVIILNKDDQIKKSTKPLTENQWSSVVENEKTIGMLSKGYIMNLIEVHIF